MMALDLGLLIAGAKERGELELRITNLISEIRAAGNVVLMSVSTLLLTCPNAFEAPHERNVLVCIPSCLLEGAQETSRALESP